MRNVDLDLHYFDHVTHRMYYFRFLSHWRPSFELHIETDYLAGVPVVFVQLSSARLFQEIVYEHLTKQDFQTGHFLAVEMHFFQLALHLGQVYCYAEH